MEILYHVVSLLFVVFVDWHQSIVFVDLGFSKEGESNPSDSNKKFNQSQTQNKRNDWLLADTCPQAANQCALF